MVPIRSAGNPQFKALLKLVQSSRERKRAGLSVLDGPHLAAAYHEHVGAPEEVVVSAAGCDDAGIRTIVAKMAPLEPVVFADSLFGRLSSVVTPTGILC